MTCERFLEGFSEYRDGLAAPEFRQEAEAHLRSCTDCRHYERVVDRGLRVLRDDQDLKVPEDFEPRLRHRLYHVDDEAALHRHVTSASTGLSVLGIAILLSALAWSPLLRPAAPVVELAPIVVSRPPANFWLRQQLMQSAGARSGFVGFAGRSDDLWSDPSGLLYRHSALARGSRPRAFRQAGLNEAR